MAWIWSDELAAVAESAGIDRTRLEMWRSRPIAFALPDGGDAERLARQMLGLTAPSERLAEARCPCGERPPEATAGA
ncbi:MAG TPA: hypothetical protein VGC11_03395 [Acidimicrobiia bacterium]